MGARTAGGVAERGPYEDAYASQASQLEGGTGAYAGTRIFIFYLPHRRLGSVVVVAKCAWFTIV